MNADFISAIQELGKEKGIEPELLYQAVEDALVAAYKKNSNTNQNVRVDMNKETGEIHVYAQRTVVEGVPVDETEMTVQEAQAIDPRYLAGDIVESGLFTHLTAFVFLVFCLLYTPCVAAIATVRRELGRRYAVLVVLMQCSIAWCVAFAVYHIGKIIFG